MKEEEMKVIARVFKEAIENKDNEEKLSTLKQEICQLCQKFSIYKGK
jgi:glycine/serine hydroxymethyltransferase